MWSAIRVGVSVSGERCSCVGRHESVVAAGLVDRLAGRRWSGVSVGFVGAISVMVQQGLVVRARIGWHGVGVVRGVWFGSGDHVLGP